jgi:rhodanese-related sulfurtransferase
MGDKLIQAIELRDTDKPYVAGLGQYFRFRNHGAAEFEFGAIPEAIRRMRLAYDSLRDVEINIHGHKAFVICQRSDEAEATEFFKAELRGSRSVSRAYLCLREVYGIGENEKPLHNEVAWFNLSADVPWVVCKTPEVRLNWRQGLEDKSKPVYAYCDTSSRVSTFYSKDDFETEINRFGYKREGMFLERIDLDKIWSAGSSGVVHITYGSSLVATVRQGSYAEAIVDGVKLKSKNPDVVFLWREIKMNVETTYSYEVAPPEERKRW